MNRFGIQTDSAGALPGCGGLAELGLAALQRHAYCSNIAAGFMLWSPSRPLQAWVFNFVGTCQAIRHVEADSRCFTTRDRDAGQCLQINPKARSWETARSRIFFGYNTRMVNLTVGVLAIRRLLSWPSM